MKKTKNFRQRNPDTLFKEYKTIIDKYDNLFQHLYAAKYWNRCKNIIMYYFSLLYGINTDLSFAVHKSLYKISNFPYKIYEYLDDQYNFIGITGEKLELLDWILDKIRQYEEAYPNERTSLFDEYLTVLKQYYDQFKNDIAVCRKLSDTDKELDQKIYKKILKQRETFKKYDKIIKTPYKEFYKKLY